MQGSVWDPEELKEPLVTGEVSVVEWKHATGNAPRFRVVLTTQGMPDHDLAQYKGRDLYLTLEDGRQARVRVQYVSTLPTGMISTLRVVGDWTEDLVPHARKAA